MRLWQAICRSERIWCSLCLRQAWMTGKRVPLSEIDPPAVPRPVGHEEAVSWREICQAEFHIPRFECVHAISGGHDQRGTCSLCKRVIDAGAGTGRDRPLKLILAGSETVGKTSFMLRFVDGVNAKMPFLATIGIDYKIKRCRTTDGVEVNLLIWDTAGPVRFRSITNSYYRGADGCVFLFDVSRHETFEDIERSFWPGFVDAQPRRAVEGCACALVLVGIRQDLTTGRVRAVSKLEAYQLAQHMEKTLALDTDHQRVHYIEANPATGDGVARAMATLVKMMLRNEARGPDIPPLDDSTNPTRHVAKNHCAVM